MSRSTGRKRLRSRGKKSAPSSVFEQLPHIPPPVFALAAAITQRLIARKKPVRRPLRMITAGVLTVGSLVLIVGTAREFRLNGTTLDPIDPHRTSHLVSGGPLAVSRNPIYLGMAGLLTAHALWRGSWAALLPVAGFVAAIDRLQIPQEEQALHEKFGKTYAAYCRDVPRWLPTHLGSSGGER